MAPHLVSFGMFLFFINREQLHKHTGYSLTFQQYMDTVHNDQFRVTNIFVTSDKGQLWRSCRILCVSHFGILRNWSQPLLCHSNTERLKVMASYPGVDRCFSSHPFSVPPSPLPGAAHHCSALCSCESNSLASTCVLTGCCSIPNLFPPFKPCYYD